ncbi:MAG TPA: CaiB/BaiF CoA-transferase family protein [Vicinamibacterales bacterium]|nr:CaiB/BaiF CoA-transferase family protein [Vicinamibacterales bacterium]
MRPLEGVRILDLSRMIAGGAAGMLLADFGADVVKVEQPGTGDPLRQWTLEGQPFWWKVYARNKRYITLNLKSDEGKELLRRMLPKFDVMLESFVPGTLERLGLGWDVISTWNPRLILVRISGWGQTGPSSGQPGFGTLVEAASGFAAMNGEPDGAPIVPSFPLADMASGLYAANALMFALYDRDVHGGTGQVIDVALFESLFSLLGPLAAEYAAMGRLRGREGSRSKNAGPRGCYPTKDGRWIAVSGSTPRMAERFLESYALGHLLADERFATNEARVQHSRELDAEVAKAIAVRTLEENLEIIRTNSLTAVAVQTVADIERDPHWRIRQLIVDVPNGNSNVRMHNVTPRLSATPGEIRWAGGALGEDNNEVYRTELGLSCDDLNRLKETGVI